MSTNIVGKPLPPVREETFDEMNSLDDAFTHKRRSEVARKLVGASKKVMERSKALHDAAAAYSARLKAEADALGEEATSLEKEITQLKNDIAMAVENDEITPDLAEALDDDLDRSRSIVYEGDVAALLPHKRNGPFLRLFLGHVNVVAARRDVRLKVKDEYNSYRDRTALLFLGFASVLLLLMHKVDGCVPGILLTAYQAWLLFFYTSLALRENILRINGSDIRPWWIRHHYFAMATAVVGLTWALDGEGCFRKQANMKLFLMWAVLQGVVMLLQNRYQRRRLYTRIALGKAGRMDVVWGESAGVKGQLWLLYPSLFVLQGSQFYMGVLLLQSALFEVWEWQVLVCGVLLLIMAIGNFTNTVGTLVTKARIKARMKRKGNQILQQLPSGESFFKKSPSM